MNSENKRWQQVCGGIFIALAVALFVWSAVDLAKHRETFARLQRNLRQLSIDPSVVESLAPHSPVMQVIDNPVALCLLFVGIAWFWNSRKRVGIWAYGILGVYLVALVFLVGAMLFSIWRKHVPVESSQLAPIIVGLVVYLGVAGILFWRAAVRARQLSGSSAAPGRATPPPVKRPVPARAAHYATCNVLQNGAVARQIWQFDARNGAFTFGREQASPAGQPLPARLVAKSWSSLWQKKLNVAWLPPENVFVRVAQFPQSTPEETFAMVELQLEKLSPIPVTQAVWSLHILPRATGNMQTVIVTVASRNVVEEFLGKLEGDGFLADRLELPMLDELQATEIREDGAWIFPEPQGGRKAALVAWWYGGVLQNVDLLTLPADHAAIGLKDQLMQMAWAGELEGWMTSAPRWHLVGEDAVAAEWVTPLQEGLEQLIEVLPPLPVRELAARTANRAAHTSGEAGLLPAEFVDRYRQQFLERLWMRGLVSMLAVYGLVLVGYFSYIAVLNYRTSAAEAAVLERGGAYTNALQIKAQYQVLQDRQELKYAALDCWEALAETQPENITLESFIFGESRSISGGKLLSLVGTAPASEMTTLFDFSDKLRRFVLPGKSGQPGKPLFSLNNSDTLHTTAIAGGAVRWTYDLELKRSEGL